VYDTAQTLQEFGEAIPLLLWVSC